MEKRSTYSAYCIAVLATCTFLTTSVPAQPFPPSPQAQNFSGAAIGTALVAAADANNDALLVDQLRKGIDPDTRGQNNMTGLMRAAIRGHKRVAEILLHFGADPNLRDASGKTALNYAVEQYQLPVAELLLSYGADINVLPPQQQFSNLKFTVRQRPLTAQQREDFYKQVELGNRHEFRPAWVFGGAALGLGAAVGIAAATGGSNNTNGVNLPTSFDTTLYGPINIGADIANQRGYTGKNIPVAVIDSGVDIDHPALKDNISSASYDFVDNDTDASPEGVGGFYSHGTHVAGVIAARDVAGNGMQGIAYDAPIIALRNGSAIGEIFDPVAATNHAIDNGARVINNSWGVGADVVNINDVLDISDLDLFFYEGESDAYVRTANAGIVTVFAAGNEEQTETSIQGALPALLPQLSGKWLTVVAVDETNTIAGFSNFCGQSQDWCLAAPGVGIISTVALNDPISDTNLDGYEPFSGSSMAAPHVAGAIAVLMEAFPSLTAEQVVDLLLTTATDLGEPGVDAIYGHGIVNLAAATQPQGQLVVPVGNNVENVVPLDESYIAFSNAFGDASRRLFSEVAILDVYQRAYRLELQQLARSAPSAAPLPHERLSAFGQANNVTTLALAKNAQLTLHPTPASDPHSLDRKTEAALQQPMEFTANYQNTDIGVANGFSVDEVFRFSSTSRVTKEDTVSESPMANPYLAMVDEGITTSVGHALSQNTRFRAGAFSGESTDAQGDIRGWVSEIHSQSTTGHGLTVQVGMIQEDDQILGSQFSGAFGADQSTTWFTSIGGELHVTEHLSVLGTFSAGLTDASPAGLSLLTDFEHVTSQAFSLGATYRGAVRQDDMLGLIVHQPLRISSGSMGLNLPTGRDIAGSVNHKIARVGLTPDGQEIDLETFYTLPLHELSGALHAGAMLRLQPDHQKEASPEALILTKYRQKF